MMQMFKDTDLMQRFLEIFEVSAAGIGISASKALDFSIVKLFFDVNETQKIKTDSDECAHFNSQLDSVIRIIETHNVNISSNYQDILQKSCITYDELETILRDNWDILKDYSRPYRLLIDLVQTSFIRKNPKNMKILEELLSHSYT